GEDRLRPAPDPRRLDAEASGRLAGAAAPGGPGRDRACARRRPLRDVHLASGPGPAPRDGDPARDGRLTAAGEAARAGPELAGRRLLVRCALSLCEAAAYGL